MSKISQLIGKGEKIEFDTENGKVEFLIKPLKNKELLEVIDFAERKDTKDMLLRLLRFTLQKDDGSVTDQEIENMETPFLMQLLKVITKVNGLEGMFDFQAGGQSISPPLSFRKQGQDSIVETLNANPRRPVRL